jgi:hypothetical protein
MSKSKSEVGMAASELGIKYALVLNLALKHQQ